MRLASAGARLQKPRAAQLGRLSETEDLLASLVQASRDRRCQGLGCRATRWVWPIRRAVHALLRDRDNSPSADLSLCREKLPDVWSLRRLSKCQLWDLFQNRPLPPCSWESLALRRVAIVSRQGA